MGKLYFKVEADYEKVIKLREEISKLKNELRGMDNTQQSAKFNSLNEQLGKCTKEMDSLVAKAAQGGAKLEQTFREAINGISSDPLKSFDAELVKMCGNLNKYFDELLAKMESMSSLLQVGKVSVDGSTSNNIPTQQLDELRSKNTELTEQLRIQKAEIKQQQEEWDKLAMAIKTNNVSAIEQYKQATNASSDAVKNAKTELKGLAKDLDENIKYFDKLTIQASAYAEELAKMQDAKDKGLSRVVVGAGGTSMPINDEIDRLNISLQEVRGNQKGVALEISNQKQRQTELNQIIEQGNGKHARTRTLIMDAREQLIQMRAAGLQNTAQYQQSAEELGKMRKQMVLVNAEMAYLSNPNKNLATFKAGLSGIASSASLVAGVMGIFNQKNEEMAIIQTKIQSLLGIIVGLEGTYNMIKKSSILMLALENVQRKASIASQALEAKAKTNNIALTWSEVAAQKAFNLVAEANPYVLLATAILSVIGGIWLLVKANKEGAKAQEEMNKKMETAKVMRESYIQSFASTASSQMSIYQKLKKEYDLLGNSLKDKNKFILENQDSFHQLGLAVNGVSDAENIFITQSNAVTNAIMQRAKAAAIGKIAQEKWEQYFKERENSIALQSGLSGISSKVEYKDGMPTRSLSFDKNKSDSTREELDKSIDQNDEKIKALKDGAEKWSELQIEVENGINDILKQAGIGIYDKNTSKQENQAEKEAEKQLKRQEQLSEQLLSLRRKNQQDEINLMADGTEKKLAQIDLDYRKELDAIRKQEQEWSKANGGKLTEEQSVQISLSYSQAESKRDKSISDVNKEELEAMNRYLKEYGTFQQKKEAITKEYADKIAKATTEGDKKFLQKEMEEAIQGIDMSELKQSMDWEQVFGNLDKVSTSTLKKLKANLKDFISNQKDLSPENLKELVDAIERIDDKVSERNPFEAMSVSFKSLKSATDIQRKAQEAYNKALKEGTDEEQKNAKATLEGAKNNKQKALYEANIALHKGVDEIGQYVEAGNQVIGIMETLGIKTPEWLEGTMSGFGEMLNGLEKIDLMKPMSIVTGGLQTVKGALTSIISLGGLISGFGGADYSQYNKMVAQYEQLSTIWDELIDKKKEYIDISYGSEALKAGQEALDIIDKSQQAQRNLARARASSGASAGSHSIAYRQNKGLGGYAPELYKYVSQNGNYNDITSALLGASEEQLKKVREQMPEMWAGLDGDFREHLDNIISGAEQTKEVLERMKEAVTGMSFDEFRSGYVDLLSDLDSTNEDFADNFEKYLQNAIFESLLANKYKDQVQDLYDTWSEYGKDGLSSDEAQKLRDMQKQLTESMIAERDKLMADFGWESDSESSSQSSTSRGFQAMSQDTGEELNGRFTALQIAGEEIRNQNIAQSQSLNLLTAKADTILSVNTETRNIADDTRDLIAQSYLELVQISENTGAIVKPIQQMQKDMAEVKKNTAGLAI